jgi:hypothetical protein
MPLWTFSPTSGAYRGATGSSGMVATLPVRVESDLGNDYYTGLRNETEAIRTVRQGEVIETRPGDVIRVLTTVYTQNGEIQITVIQQDKGLEEQQVTETVAVEEVAEVPPAATGPIVLSVQDYLKLSLEERNSGKYTASSAGVAQGDHTAAAPIAPAIESAAPAGYYEPNYYAPQQQTYTDPYVGTQYVPPSSSYGGTGDAPGYSGPVNNYERGPDITSEGNEGYWL